jgi:hypothetical protein
MPRPENSIGSSRIRDRRMLGGRLGGCPAGEVLCCCLCSWCVRPARDTRDMDQALRAYPCLELSVPYRELGVTIDCVKRRQSSGIICAPVGTTMRELQEIFQESALKDLAPA